MSEDIKILEIMEMPEVARLTEANWEELLREQVKALGCAEVARQLGVSRTAVSLLVHAKYPGKADRLITKIIDVFGKHHCPRLHTLIKKQDCLQLQSEPIPTSSPADLRGWRQCFNCTHNNRRKP